jgi:hypothetical protein
MNWKGHENVPYGEDSLNGKDPKLGSAGMGFIVLGIVIGIMACALLQMYRQAEPPPPTEKPLASDTSWHISSASAPPEDFPVIGYFERRDAPGYPDVLACRIIHGQAYEFAPSDRPVRLLYGRVPDLWERLP